MNEDGRLWLINGLERLLNDAYIDHGVQMSEIGLILTRATGVFIGLHAPLSSVGMLTDLACNSLTEASATVRNSRIAKEAAQ